MSRRLFALILVNVACAGSQGPAKPDIDAAAMSSPDGGMAGMGGSVAGMGGGVAGAGGGGGGAGGRPADPDRDWLGPSFEQPNTMVVEGNTLFWLDHRRGLTVLDATPPAAPAVLSRLEVGGAGSALFQRGKTLLAVLDRRLAYGACPTCPLGTQPSYGAAVVAVDVTDPRQPRLRGEVQVRGEVSAARMVGDLLYLATAVRGDQQHVGVAALARTVRIHVIATTDPTGPRLQRMLELPLEFPTPTIELADDRAYLLDQAEATDARPCKVPGVDGTIESPDTCLRITAVDLIGPTPGAAASADVAYFGQLQWRAGILRLVSVEPDNDDSRVVVRTFEARTPAQLVPTGVAAVTVPGWGGDVPVLDGTRLLMVPWRTGAMRTVDLTDPARPKLVGKLDDVAGPALLRGDRLVVARGQPPLPGTPGRAYSLELVTVDLANLAQPRIAGRAALATGPLQEGRDSVLVNLAAVEPMGLVLAPFEITSTGAMSSRTGVQGFVLGAGGALDDAGVAPISFGRERVALVGNRLAAVSNARVQLLTTEGGLRPAETVPLGLDVRAFAATADGIAAATVDARTRAASLHTVGGPGFGQVGPPVPLDGLPARVLIAGSHAIVITGGQGLEVIELGASPRRAGKLTLGARAITGAIEVVSPHLLAVPFQRKGDCSRTPPPPDCAGWNHDLALISLADPAAPRVAWQGSLADPAVPYADSTIRVKGTTVTVSLRQIVENDPMRRNRYWMVDVDATVPQQAKVGPPREIPGAYLGDVAGVSYGLEDVDLVLYRLHAFQPRGDAFETRASLLLDERAWTVALGPRAAYFAADGKLAVIDLANPGALKVTARFELPGAGFVRFSDGQRDSHDLVWAETVAGDTLFVALQQAMLAFDVRSPLAPRWRAAFPTKKEDLGSQLRFSPDGKRALVASGRYPIQALEVTGP